VSLTLLRQQVQTAVAGGFAGYDSQAFPFEGVSEDRDLVSVWIVDLNEQSDDVIVQQVAVAVRVSPRWVPNSDTPHEPARRRAARDHRRDVADGAADGEDGGPVVRLLVFPDDRRDAELRTVGGRHDRARVEAEPECRRNLTPA
jgi:hypothetical protein